jgi:hypothetical protein
MISTKSEISLEDFDFREKEETCPKDGTLGRLNSNDHLTISNMRQS